MKKILYLSLLCITFYVASMYHSFPLMVLFLAELLMAAGMWMSAFYLSRHLTLKLSKQQIMGSIDEDICCRYQMKNTGKLPLSRVRIRANVSYQQEKKGRKTYLYGVEEEGSDQFCIKIEAPYCGVIILELNKLKIYDYLGLFSVGRKLEEIVTVDVFPPEFPLMIESFFNSNQNHQGQENLIGNLEHGHEDIRQLREYQDGDSHRYIHWNQSAKTDRIWVKEYEKEEFSVVNLTVKIEEEQWNHPDKMDTFYRILYALMLGLLQRADVVRIDWNRWKTDQKVSVDIRQERECQEMLLRIYQTDFLKIKEKSDRKNSPEYMPKNQEYLKFDSALRLYHNENLIHHFNIEDAKQEIENQSVLIQPI